MDPVPALFRDSVNDTRHSQKQVICLESDDPKQEQRECVSELGARPVVALLCLAEFCD
jgi:hypothetical protein